MTMLRPNKLPTKTERMKLKSGKGTDLASKEAYERPVEEDQWRVLGEARYRVGRQMAPQFFQDNGLRTEFGGGR